jgi:hypothetical protein
LDWWWGWVYWRRLEKYRKMKYEIDNEKHKLASEFGEKEFWDKVKYLLNHQEISRLLSSSGPNIDGLILLRHLLHCRLPVY